MDNTFNIDASLYALAHRQARRFHNLAPADREDLVHDTFERLIAARISIDLSRSPAGFLYHALRRTLSRAFQKAKQHEERENDEPLRKGDKPSRRTQWDSLDALLARCEEKIHQPSFSTSIFTSVLNERLTDPKNREYAAALLQEEGIIAAGESIGLLRDAAKYRFKRIRNILQEAREKASLA